jgi:hypothetical protein
MSNYPVYSTFKILPNLIFVTPTEGTVGVRVTVAGNGFGKDKDIVIDFGTTKTVQITPTDASGSFMTAFRVDTQPYGKTTIKAHGSEEAYAVFRILANITSIVPTYGTIGSKVTITGTGYGGNEEIAIDFGKTLTIATCVSNIAGSFTVTFTVDIQPAGTTTISVKGIATNQICHSYFVIILSPEIFISPVTGTVGSIVEVKGAGFDLKEEIIIHFGNTLSIAIAQADEFW